MHVWSACNNLIWEKCFAEGDDLPLLRSAPFERQALPKPGCSTAFCKAVDTQNPRCSARQKKFGAWQAVRGVSHPRVTKQDALCSFPHEGDLPLLRSTAVYAAG